MQTIANFIDNRRKAHELSREKLAGEFGISLRTYNDRLTNDGFTGAQIVTAAKLLKFDVMLLPGEADIYTTGTLA